MKRTRMWAVRTTIALAGAAVLSACSAPPCPQMTAGPHAGANAGTSNAGERSSATSGSSTTQGASTTPGSSTAASGNGDTSARNGGTSARNDGTSGSAATAGRGVLRDARGTALSGKGASVPRSLRPWLGALDDSGSGRSGLQQRFDGELAAGRDVTTSLDATWHRRLETVFARVERGAGVVLSLPDGKVRALFSTLPHNDDDGLAARHLATSRPTNAGSTFKPFTTIAALAAGAMQPATKHTCDGALLVGKRRFHCWGKHGEMDAAKALAMSDNIFFWKLVLKMQHDDVAKTQHAFGLGEPVSLLPKASAGFIPLQHYFESDGRTMQKGHTLNQSIGHGHVLITPLQLARGYAALATGALPQLSLNASDKPQSIPLDPSWRPHLSYVRKALRGTLTEPHGSAHFAGKTPDAAGKTGTASKLDHDFGSRNGRRSLGWFAGWAPAEKPTIAFAFVVEGNTGPQTAKLVLKALRDATQ